MEGVHLYKRTGWISIGLIVSRLLATEPVGDLSAAKALEEARMLIETKNYERARLYLERLARHGNKAAMYRLGDLYEKGLGVRQSYKMAAMWYKKAADDYRFTQEVFQKSANLFSPSIADRFKAQFTSASNIAANEAMLANLQTRTPETRSLLEELASGRFFGLQPYKSNYLIPLAYSTTHYRR